MSAGHKLCSLSWGFLLPAPLLERLDVCRGAQVPPLAHNESLAAGRPPTLLPSRDERISLFFLGGRVFLFVLRQIHSLSQIDLWAKRYTSALVSVDVKTERTDQVLWCLISSSQHLFNQTAAQPGKCCKGQKKRKPKVARIPACTLTERERPDLLFTQQETETPIFYANETHN